MGSRFLFFARFGVGRVGLGFRVEGFRGLGV